VREIEYADAGRARPLRLQVEARAHSVRFGRQLLAERSRLAARGVRLPPLKQGDMELILLALELETR
jgi:hypothetical protein